MSALPRVSVLTPVFNGAVYLEQCIESVLAQTSNDVEHVFADGGSTDGTLEILQRYHEKYPERIRFVSGPDNGVGSALKKAYRLSRGAIIGWIDSDDRYEPHAIATAISYFDAHPDAYYIYGGCDIIDANSEVIGNFLVKDYDRKEWLNVWHYIVFCATFFKREVVETVGFVNDLGNDLCFYMRVSKRFKMHRIPETLTNWRFHVGSISLKPSPREQAIRYARAKEDFFLVLRHRGSIFSPRALTWYAVMEPNIARRLRPVLGFSYPFLKRIAHQVKFSIAVVQRRNGSFAIPLMANIFSATREAFGDYRRARKARRLAARQQS